MVKGIRLSRTLRLRIGAFVALALFVVGASRASQLRSEWQRSAEDPLARIASAPEQAAQSRELIDFLERRVRGDRGDADVWAKLAGLYLQRLRRTGSLTDLDLALRAAQSSLAIVPAIRNTDGLASLAQAEFAAHEFGLARDHARQWAQLDASGAPYALLGDTFTELGDYAVAERAYLEMRRRSAGIDENVATRMARSAQLRGDYAGATHGFATARALELGRSEPSRERIAWFDWQLGDSAFFNGDDAAAQAHYDAALTAYPGYFRALASRGRLDAARGDLARAIADYGAAVRTLPDPTFVAELGDVYELAGRETEAQNQYGLVELIDHLSKINGVMYNRQVAMFYADHNRNVEAAYADAKREYAVRHDILGADALAWTALKAGRIAQAQTAMKAALRLGSRDPRLLYHAGMIARAAGDRSLSRTYLEHALALNPRFDALQSVTARAALGE